MDQLLYSLLLCIHLGRWVMTDMVAPMLDQLTLGTSIHLVFAPTILSGAFALLVKHLAITRIIPLYRIASGGLLALLVSWYIDRVCSNNTYLLVRAVGVSMMLCAALGLFIACESGSGAKPPALETEVAVAGSAEVTVMGRD